LAYTAVTGSFIAPFAIYNLLLSMNVIRARMATGTSLGDRSATPASSSSKNSATSLEIDDIGDSPKASSSAGDPLLVSCRIQANFLENVPLALTLAAVVELNGGNRKALAYVLSGLLVARVSHAFGLGNRVMRARQVGYFGSLAVIVSLGNWGAWLCKGYWGF